MDSLKMILSNLKIFSLVLLLVVSPCLSLSISDAEPSSVGLLIRSRRGDNLRKRLCPDGSAYHNETAICHKLLEQGPCGNLQLFYGMTQDSNYGTCACMANMDGCNQRVLNNRMLLLSPAGDQCYWAYSQGPCQSGEWYILDMKSMKPECQKNPCCTEKDAEKPVEDVVKTPKTETDVFTFAKDGVCYKTFTQAYCSEGQYLQFVGTHSPYPKCFRVKAGPNCVFSVGTSAGLPCEAGHKLVGDDCVPIAEFE